MALLGRSGERRRHAVAVKNALGADVCGAVPPPIVEERRVDWVRRCCDASVSLDASAVDPVRSAGINAVEWIADHVGVSIPALWIG